MNEYIKNQSRKMETLKIEPNWHGKTEEYNISNEKRTGWAYE